MAKTMKAAVVRAFGTPLTIEEVPIPTPGPGARIRGSLGRTRRLSDGSSDLPTPRHGDLRRVPASGARSVTNIAYPCRPSALLRFGHGTAIANGGEHRSRRSHTTSETR